MKNHILLGFLIIFCSFLFIANAQAATSSSITVLSPNGGEVWTHGENHIIAHNFPGILQIGYKLLKDSQVVFTAIGPIDANSQHNLYIDSSFGTGNTYKVRVYDWGNSQNFDDSDLPFSILPPSTVPTIITISPSSGPVGTVVAIYGTNFTSSNTVNLTPSGAGPGGQLNALSSDGSSIIFSVPSNFTTPGAYGVSVGNAKGSSNNIAFSVTSQVTPTADIKISGSDGPVLVKMGDPIAVMWSSSNASYCKGTGYSFSGTNYGYWGNTSLPTNGTEFSPPLTGGFDIGIQCFSANGLQSGVDKIDVQVVSSFTLFSHTNYPTVYSNSNCRGPKRQSNSIVA